MGQILHPRARTTEEVRREIQNSKESINALAKRYGVNFKTILKWKHRDYVHDSPMGPKDPHSTVLTREEEAICVAFRKHTLLPLDDCLYALQESIPHLSRSSLHRLFKRNGINRLPQPEEKKEQRKKFKKYPIGYFHIDITEVRTEEGKLYLFVAIDRTSKFAYVELVEKQGKMQAAQFLRNLIAKVPYKIHKILTDNGVQFTNLHRNAKALPHIFDRVCIGNGITHRLTKPVHPWTNGQVERMNKTIKEATVHRYYYESQDQLREHLQAFIDAYNFAKRLKTLDGLTPWEFIIKQWTIHPESFKINPNLYKSGPYSSTSGQYNGMVSTNFGNSNPNSQSISTNYNNNQSMYGNSTTPSASHNYNPFTDGSLLTSNNDNNFNSSFNNMNNNSGNNNNNNTNRSMLFNSNLSGGNNNSYSNVGYPSINNNNNNNNSYSSSYNNNNNFRK